MNAEHSPIFELGGEEGQPILLGAEEVINSYKEARLMNDFGKSTHAKHVKTKFLSKKYKIKSSSENSFLQSIFFK